MLADRPHISTTDFEEAARIFARLERGARLELIDGKALHLPDPVGITLETEALKDRVN